MKVWVIRYEPLVNWCKETGEKPKEVKIEAGSHETAIASFNMKYPFNSVMSCVCMDELTEMNITGMF